MTRPRRLRCRCYRTTRKVWVGFGRYIRIKGRCEMHRRQDEMTAKLKREIAL